MGEGVATNRSTGGGPRWNAGLIAVATLLAMGAWFSTGAVGPALQAARGYSGTDLTWMAVAV